MQFEDAVGYEEQPRDPCVLCDTIHPPDECAGLKEMPPQDLLALVFRKGYCIRCLRNHRSSYCKWAVRCIAAECNKRHHPMLHAADFEEGYAQRNAEIEEMRRKREEERRVKPQETTQQVTSESTPVAVDVTTSESATVTRIGCALCTEVDYVALPIVPLWLSYGGQSLLIYGLQDGGANVTTLRKHAADALGMTGPEIMATICTMNDETPEVKKTIKVDFTSPMTDR